MAGVGRLSPGATLIGSSRWVNLRDGVGVVVCLPTVDRVPRRVKRWRGGSVIIWSLATIDRMPRRV